MSASERIREAASIKGMNIKEFSEALGVSYRTVQNYISGERGIGSDFLAAAAERLGVSATWILTGVGAPLITPEHPNECLPDGKNTVSDFEQIPRYQVDAAAGHGATVEDEAVSGHYAFNRKWLTRRNLNPKNLAVISVRGDSMEPRLRDGDLIVLDKSQTDIADGRAFVLRLGTDLVVKYIQRLGASRISLLSANTFYPPREIDLDKIDGEAEIIGRVVASMQEW